MNLLLKNCSIRYIFVHVCPYFFLLIVFDIYHTSFISVTSSQHPNSLSLFWHSLDIYKVRSTSSLTIE